MASGVRIVLSVSIVSKEQWIKADLCQSCLSWWTLRPERDASFRAAARAAAAFWAMAIVECGLWLAEEVVEFLPKAAPVL